MNSSFSSTVGFNEQSLPVSASIMLFSRLALVRFPVFDLLVRLYDVGIKHRFPSMRVTFSSLRFARLFKVLLGFPRVEASKLCESGVKSLGNNWLITRRAVDQSVAE